MKKLRNLLKFMQLNNDLDIRLYNFYVLDKLYNWGMAGYTGIYKKRLGTKEVMRKVDARDGYLKSLDRKLSYYHLAKSSWYYNYLEPIIWEKVHKITIKGVDYIENLDPVHRSSMAIKIFYSSFDDDIERIFINRELSKVPIADLPTFLTHDNRWVRNIASYFYDTKID